MTQNLKIVNLDINYGGNVKKIILIIAVVVLLSACAVKRSDFDALNRQVATQQEKINLLEEQMASMGYNNIYQLNDHIQALNNRVNNLEGGKSTYTESPSTNTNPLAGVSDQVTNLYNEGRRLYELRDFPSAIRSFQSVTQQAPNHELAANSYYWIGESYYAMADFSAARLAFQRISDQYPDSNKFIDAQLKIAMTWLRQNRKDHARTILLAIKRDFPRYENMALVDQQLRLAQ